VLLAELLLGAGGFSACSRGNRAGSGGVLGPLVTIAQAGPDRYFVEPYLAVDPGDAGHLVATAIEFSRPHGTRCAAFVSRDRGATWRESPPRGWNRPRYGMDPWLAFGSAGSVYLSCIETTQSPSPVEIFRSVDGGDTWGEPLRVPFGKGSSFDHTALLADDTTTPSRGRLWLLGLQSVRTETGPGVVASLSMSLGAGLPFGEPREGVVTPGGFNVSSPALLSDGTVVFPVLTVDDANESGPTGLSLVRFAQGAESFSEARKIAGQGAHEFPGFAVRRCGSPARDRLLVAWIRKVGTTDELTFLRSLDGGERWSQPHRIDDVGRGASLLQPTVAVGPGEEVAVSWLEAQLGGDEVCWELFAAISEDDGVSFGVPLRVSTSPSCAVPRSRWRGAGDYMGLAFAGPELHLLWAGGPADRYALQTRTLRLPGLDSEDGGGCEG
jgi:hypothetical protein